MLSLQPRTPKPVVVLALIGYAWYRLVSYPRAKRWARKHDCIPVGENIFGDTILVPYDENAARPMDFSEWWRRPVNG